MFARIMAMVLAVILLTTVGLSVVWWITLRNQQIENQKHNADQKKQRDNDTDDACDGIWPLEIKMFLKKFDNVFVVKVDKRGQQIPDSQSVQDRFKRRESLPEPLKDRPEPVEQEIEGNARCDNDEGSQTFAQLLAPG